MFLKTITKETKRNMELLRGTDLAKDFYLAGGTGLALQIGHRRSIDLDFFCRDEFNTMDIKNKLSRLGRFSVTKEEKNTLNGILNGTRISYFHYLHPLLYPFKKLTGIKIAASMDIACMKVDVISSRGLRKDFIDMYFLCRKVKGLGQILKIFKRKYKSIAYNEMHILKSMVYFKDADDDPMPDLLVDIDWDKVKTFFREEVKKLKPHFL